MQETFLALVKKRPHIADENHLKYWLIRVAVNKSRNLIKSAAWRRLVSLEAAATRYKLNDGDIGVIDYINKLPREERNIVILHYVEGFSASEIGGIIGKTEAAVFKRLSRIRAKLRGMREE
jgi:RNA polymerase sigma-70 factor (ECF subfamily)